MYRKLMSSEITESLPCVHASTSSAWTELPVLASKSAPAEHAEGRFQLVARASKLACCLILLGAATVVAEEKGSGAATAPPAVAATPAVAAPPASTSPATPPAAVAPATPDAGAADTAKQLRGMSVLGNNEAPMSLFIVPWKSSELGVETNLSRTLNERDVPVDRDVFLREVEFYEVSVGGWTAAPPGVVSQVAK